MTRAIVPDSEIVRGGSAASIGAHNAPEYPRFAALGSQPNLRALSFYGERLQAVIEAGEGS